MADKLKQKVEDIKNIVIWGNHSLTQVPDLNNAVLSSNHGKKSVLAEIND